MDNLPRNEAARDETSGEKAPAAQRAKWERPVLRRLAADDAELNLTSGTDGPLGS